MSEQHKDCVPLKPNLLSDGKARALLLEFARKLGKIADRNETVALRTTAFRAAEEAGKCNHELRVCVSVLCDLRVQGWTFRVEGSQLWGCPPEADSSSFSLEKQRVREAHLFERDSQLCLPATRQFIRSMETKRVGANGWVSVLSLVRDGPDLSAKLRAIDRCENEAKRLESLRACIDPYIQVVERDATCEFTGLRLADIWRYFRHTWVIPYHSVPGRQVCLLVRDAAAENHPIIGIAALGSAVVQLTPRDNWIGWTPARFIESLEQKPTKRWAEWIWQSWSRLVKAVYINDFLEEQIVRRRDLLSPSPKIVDTLLSEAVLARQWHTKFPKSSQHKKSTQDWEQEARSYLFRAKRAKVLAELLAARLNLLEAGFKSPTKHTLGLALKTSPGRRGIQVIIRHMKASHIGVDMLDIMVCGAVAPYNPLLGGKLVAMLVTSPEVAVAYERRYGNTPSIIASSMAGKPALRTPQLVLLGTTSLYGVASSQYNRLRIPAEEVGGKPATGVQYELLGRSLGFGSNHLSPTTVDEIEVLLARSEGGRRVNSIFGEGVNPRFRKIRDGLALVGLPSDSLLMHGNARIIYGISLASNFREVLLGVAKRANFIYGRSNPREVTRKIGDYWIKRWLSKRILREDTLPEVEKHSVNYPLEHGARVILPSCTEE